jgi:hypothetical protein
MSARPSTISEGPDSLARACADHLAREEAHLEAALAALRRVRSALVGGAWGALPGLLAEHGRLAAGAEELARDRDVFQEELAPLAGVPKGEVTVRAVARALPDDLGAPLLAARDRLAARAGEAERLARDNAALLGHSLDFFRRLFEALTGSGEDVGRYGPGGRRQGGGCGPLFQARG